MVMQNKMDEMTCTAKKAYKKTCKFYDFMKSLSLKHKLNFDIQLKSDKSIMPLYRCCHGWNKEFRVFPVLIWMLSAMLVLCGMKMTFKNK